PQRGRALPPGALRVRRGRRRRTHGRVVGDRDDSRTGCRRRGAPRLASGTLGAVAATAPRLAETAETTTTNRGTKATGPRRRIVMRQSRKRGARFSAVLVAGAMLLGACASDSNDASSS